MFCEGAASREQSFKNVLGRRRQAYLAHSSKGCVASGFRESLRWAQKSGSTLCRCGSAEQGASTWRDTNSVSPPRPRCSAEAASCGLASVAPHPRERIQSNLTMVTLTPAAETWGKSCLREFFSRRLATASRARAPAPTHAGASISVRRVHVSGHLDMFVHLVSVGRRSNCPQCVCQSVWYLSIPFLALQLVFASARPSRSIIYPRLSVPRVPLLRWLFRRFCPKVFAIGWGRASMSPIFLYRIRFFFKSRFIVVFEYSVCI